MKNTFRPMVLALLLSGVLALLPTFSFAGDLTHKISLDFRDADIRDIFKIICDKAQLGLVVEKSVRGNVTLRMIDVPVFKALDSLALANGYEWSLENDTVIVADEKKFPVLSVIRPVSHVEAGEAAKAIQVAIKKDIRVLSTDDNVLILNGRKRTLADAEKILAAIDKPRRQFLGTLEIIQGGKVMQTLEFHGFPGVEIKAFEGSSVVYPGGADQPPNSTRIGMSFEFSPRMRTGSDSLEGAVSLENTWVEKFEGSYPVTGTQKIQTFFSASPGKSVKIGKFSQDREVFISFKWQP